MGALVVGGGCGLLFENEFVKGYCAVGVPEVNVLCVSEQLLLCLRVGSVFT